MVRYVKEGVGGKRDAVAFSAIEVAKPEEVVSIQQERLREQLDYLRNRSVFYAKKLGEAGVSWNKIRTIEDLAEVPFTVKQELRDSIKAAPPFGEHLAADLSEVVQMQASSGTTGSPSYVALTASDLEIWNETSARGLFACGHRPGDLVLHALSMSKGFVGGLPVFQAVQYMGAIDVPIGADAGPDRLLAAARDLKPISMSATPNFAIFLGKVSRELIGVEARDLGIRRISVGGEPGGSIPAIRQQIEEIWGARCCELMGGTDIAPIFFAECEHQRGMHFVSPDLVLVELIDPEQGTVVPFKSGSRGELVYTALGRRASALMRFRSGDHIEVIDEQCACGRTGPLIRCFGRTDDMLIVRGINLFPSAVQDIVGEIMPDASGIMRVLADFEGHSTQKNLKVLVERGEGASPQGDAALKEELERRIRNRLAVKAEVIIVPYQSFERPGATKVSITLRQAPDFLRS